MFFALRKLLYSSAHVSWLCNAIIISSEFWLSCSVLKSFSMSGTRTKTLHFPGKKKKNNNNNKKEAWCWTKSLCYPFPYMFIKYTSYMEVESGGFPVDYSDPINCMFSNWLAWIECVLHHFARVPNANLSTSLKHNTQTFIATAQLLWNLKLVRRKKESST